MALLQERKQIPLEMESLTRLVYSYAYQRIPLERIRYIRAKMALIPDLSLSVNRYYDSREEGIMRNLRFGQAWRKIIKDENLVDEEQMLAYENTFELAGYIGHHTFFKPSLKLQASKEQVEEWMPLVERMEITGNYAQTEIAHGSNVKGLEIQAIYDHNTRSFTMHSPTPTATKWWIGGLGITSNHSLVIAVLMINGNSYGPHAFLVPLRDMKTHEPFPGVDVGDIGPKIGLHSNDNGFLRFNNYKIDKKYMLTRFSRINDQGEYEIVDPNSIKILYLSLVRARLAILTDAWFPLSSALTIAIRYSIVRQQFADPENPQKEKQIIDYQIQQHKLFTQLSRLYALLFVRSPVIELYEKIEKEVVAGGSPALDLLHCLVCLYKVYASLRGIEVIESCRRSCGGHGFLMISGLPSLYTTFLPKVTYDGENTVLGLQAIKYLLSLFHKKPPKEFLYLTSERVTPKGDPLSPSFQHQCFMAVAQYKLARVNKKFQELKSRYTKEKIWTDYLQIEGIEATEPVYQVHIHGKFCESIEKITNGVNRDAIENLRKIFVWSELEKYTGVLLLCGVSEESIEAIKQGMIQALGETRKNALGLIEAFEIPDEALHSVLGRKDGDIYSHMLANAKTQNPLNKTKVFPGITAMLRPKI